MSDDADKKKNNGKPDANEEETQASQTLQSQLEDMQDNGSVTTDNGRHIIHCLTIIGQIEGHYVLPSENKTTKYEHVIPQLVAIEESREIEGLLIMLNTVGGDIEAGLALAELIAGMKKPTVSLVLGVPQAFTYFERMQQRITGFVSSNSRMPEDRFMELCLNTGELVTDMGSVLDGDKAVEEGLIDHLGSLSDAITALYDMIDENRQNQTDEETT